MTHVLAFAAGVIATVAGAVFTLWLLTLEAGDADEQELADRKHEAGQ